jgi:hypothetical protein
MDLNESRNNMSYHSHLHQRLTPPLIPYRRAYALGEAVAAAVDSLPTDTKVRIRQSDLIMTSCCLPNSCHFIDSWQREK